MTHKGRTPLAPHEVLRVMDAAQVIHRRRQALEEHEAFDRDAAVRDIQRMYEELGDLVDSETIEKALDDYLSQRYGFTPAPPGVGRSMALLYIRRGWIARRVLLPAAAVTALIWGSIAGAGVMSERAFARDVERLRGELADIRAARATERAELEALFSQGTPPDLPAAEADEFAASLAAAGIRLSAVEEALDPIAREAAREDLARPDLDRLREGTTAVEGDLELARAGIGRADAALERHARLAALEADVVRLHAAVLAEAAEDLVREHAGDLAREAESRIAARDVDGLGAAVGRYRDLLDAVSTEYRIVVTGGVWRYPDGARDIRNHYLLVQALGTDGEAVPVTIRSEEDGEARRVRQWGERVPQEVYDRVAADRADNGIIDDEEFGFKARGFVTAERRYADIGQITEW
ncbi:MAG: hypothetical protein F4X47_14500 [Gammaproteobacteria bacterium]|nr:hypothetical protein [Gammaproteobacteria bacterium]MYC53515.1 hypothetical protein [Gammaproteobacteria bacterium]